MTAAGLDAPSPLSRSDRGCGVFALRLSGFVPLSEGDRARIMELTAHPRSVAPRTELMGEDDEVEAALVIAEGIACRYRDRDDGRRQILSYLLPGDLCDLDVLLRTRNDYAVGTLSACRVVSVPRAVLIDLVRRHPQVLKAMRLAKLADEARSRDWVMNFGCSTAVERVGHLLCEVLERLRSVGFATADGCDLPLTQNDLAETTGLSTVHVNRTLQVLRGEGLIELRGRKLKVPDLSRLQALSGFRVRAASPVPGEGPDGLPGSRVPNGQTSQPVAP